jgi:hypothetical protein
VLFPCRNLTVPGHIMSHMHRVHKEAGLASDLPQYHSSLQRLQRFSAGLPHILREEVILTVARMTKTLYLHLGSSMNSSKLFWPYLRRAEQSNTRRRTKAGSAHVRDVLEFLPFFFLAYVAYETTRCSNDLSRRGETLRSRASR